jgi:uncharacterized RDD family membrane protein YckC
MRCPKCHYISFGSADRCRNCGYEFSLAAEAPPVDLPIQDADAPVGPMRDLELIEPPRATTTPTPGRRTPDTGAGRFDLPLFPGRDPVDDTPLITVAGAPRAPLAVRRAQATAPKPLPERSPEENPAFPALEPDPLVDAARQARRAARRAAAAGPVEEAAPPIVVAPIGARLAAGAIDVLIIAAIDAAVLYSTLRVLELPLAEFRQLPVAPMTVFLMLLNGGYLAAFTAAGGQTIGKMIAGIRVVADHGAEVGRVPLGAAVLRATAYLVSLLPAGLGFAAILFDAEGRALHDRLADTRVVRA